MSTIDYTITLTSDGEPASGFGTTLTDSLLPRDLSGNIIIPSSHIKGLMRENLENHIGRFIPESALESLFGKEGGKTGALFHLDNAVAQDATVLDISRTRISRFGTAAQGSLRTSEAVAVGTQFSGTVRARPNLPKPYLQLLKLGLLSIFAIGGGRNRGSGACAVSIASEPAQPGDILRELSTISDWSVTTAPQPASISQETDSNRPVTLKLTFTAENPICVPEIPIVKNNMIKSGFTIPASAVQGTILHRLNDLSETVATACYENEMFRAWPLNPTISGEHLSFRVSLTHKISKLRDKQGRHHFEDEIIRDYEWDKIPPNSPLKSSDGVLLWDGNEVTLWKSSDMARVITAHGVVNGNRGGGQKRNLYTIEAMAPATFSGFVSMPEYAAELLKKSLKENPFVTMGKSRSIRGGGKLVVQEKTLDSIIPGGGSKTAFIVQSPILVPFEDAHKPFFDIITRLAQEYGFGKVEEASGTVTTQFGWNNTVHGGMLCAVAVIAPGSVFGVKEPVKDVQRKLISGIGAGRERGFGAVVLHPGIARTLHPALPARRKMEKIKNFGQEGFRLWEKARAGNLSASQISRIRELVSLDAQKAIAYLERQKNDRPETIWQRWKDVIDEMRQGITSDPGYYARVLKVCQDLLVADKGE